MIAHLSIETILNRYAKEYKAALLPAHIPYGELGDCFDYCALMATLNPELTYVEGVTSDPKTGEWLVHSWLTDGEHAFDPTWKATDKKTGEHVVLPCSYFGIAFDTPDVARFIIKTKMKGILHNRDLAPELFERIIKQHRVIGENVR